MGGRRNTEGWTFAGRCRHGPFIAALFLLAAAPGSRADRVVEMEALLRNDCGACHGMTLRGGLGPALTGDVLAGRSREALREVIVNGRPGTAMPPWRGQLSEADIEMLVNMLLAGGAGAVVAQPGN